MRTKRLSAGQSMFRLILSFACLVAIEGRKIQRFSRAMDNATKPVNTSAVNNLPLNFDVVAPSQGDKPLVAKYTIRARPRLKDGIPQIQEIRIMPPHTNNTQPLLKPMMVLKQNITKAIIENIEIDVPKKGIKFSSKPIVQVLEGAHKEILNVTKGQASEENPGQKSTTQDELAVKAEQEFTIGQVTPALNQSNTSQVSNQAQSVSGTVQSAPVHSQPAAAAAAFITDETCTDDGRCQLYPSNRCRDQWLIRNCRLKCNLC